MRTYTAGHGWGIFLFFIFFIIYLFIYLFIFFFFFFFWGGGAYICCLLIMCGGYLYVEWHVKYFSAVTKQEFSVSIQGMVINSCTAQPRYKQNHVKYILATNVSLLLSRHNSICCKVSYISFIL